MQTNEYDKVFEAYLKAYEGIPMEDVKNIKLINNTRDTYLIEFDNPDEIMVLEVKSYDYGEVLIYKELDNFRDQAREFINPDILEFINWDQLEEEKFSDLEVTGEFDGYVIVDTDDASFLVKRLV
jgi:hypothetical protein